MQDHYEILQIHPTADQEAVQAAYERLRARHDPAKLEGAADDLVALTRRKRDEIERAYAVLSDPKRRASYDAGHQRAESAAADSGERMPDYRPLPPAQGQERPQAFNAQPTVPADAPASTSGAGRPIWLVPAATVGVLTFVIIIGGLLMTTVFNQAGNTEEASAAQQPAMPGADAAQQPAAPANNTGGAPQPTDAEMQQIVAEYDGQVVAARQVVNELPNNQNAWIRLANALYDSTQVVRELRPDSAMYAERSERWLEASEAYATALELGAADPVVRSDMGVSLCYYSQASGDTDYAAQGVQHTARAMQEAGQNGRVLLNHGLCLVASEPPKVDEAVSLWQRVTEMPAAELGVAQQAQRLVAEYGE
jgi:curved DNA-binding protein CbpA